MAAIKNFLREQVIFLVVAFVSFSTGPAIATAQEYNPLPFAEPLSVSRGNVMPSDPDAVYLSDDDICTLATVEWGWSDCSGMDAMILSQFPDIDITIVDEPDTSGFVEFDDWNSDERQAVIDDIETSLRTGMRAQGERLGIDISFDGWAVYPTLDTDNQMMYYATSSIWDGEPSLNIEATVFDRRGYVRFRIVPWDANPTEAQVKNMIVRTLGQYEPREGEGYASFITGDRVAAVGAVGVLAALAGIQYSKGAATGIIAVALLFLKKAWFLLLLPFFWLKNLFKRKDPK